MIDPREHPSLGQALEAVFVRWANETCLVESDRGKTTRSLTFAEVAQARDGFVALLEQHHFAPHDRLAILAANQPAWHAAAAAVFHLGGVLVPLDPKLPPAEQLALLGHSGAKFLVVESHLLRALAPPEWKSAGSPLVCIALGEVAHGVPNALPEPKPAERGVAKHSPPVSSGRSDVACIVYSSGTGGRPKGCLLTHGNYLAQLASLLALHPFRPGVRYLSILPTNHAIDFMVGFLGPYLCGAKVIHLRTLRPEFVREAFALYRVTHVALVPAIVKNLELGIRRRIEEAPPLRRLAFTAGTRLLALVSQGRPHPGWGRRLLGPVHDAFGGALEAIFVGGAPCDVSSLRFLHSVGIPVANGYGLTEAGTALTLDRLDPPRPDTVGTALSGVELRIQDPGPDGVGEVLARGDTVMRGYLDDDELTRETLRGGWLHTGDLGVLLPSGHLRILGRSKNMIVTAGGKNVYPEDVERAFSGLPAKEYCIVPGHALFSDSAAGEKLILLVRLEDSSPDRETIARLAREMNRTLPAYQRADFLLFAERDFPRTASLKIKREQLARSIRASAPPLSASIALREST